MPPEKYRFNRFSHSVLLGALCDFGCDSEDLISPFSATVLGALCSAAVQRDWVCAMDHCWARKKFPPQLVPDSAYHQQDWHQDGALGVTFPAQAGEVLPMTELLTCWIPLTPCGENSPGLEFVRRPVRKLLHFTELDDAALRRRFASHEFCVPVLAPGDALVFLNGTLHRTYARPDMQYPRLSAEYRVFPRTSAPL